MTLSTLSDDEIRLYAGLVVLVGLVLAYLLGVVVGALFVAPGSRRG